MSKYTEFKNLNLSNYFLFPAVMEDEEICTDMLKLCTGERLTKVQVHTEENRYYDPRKRALRLDVKAWNSGIGYNEETRDKNRLYDNYVIFICTFDPFCGGRYRYIYENRDIEDGLSPGKTACRIYLNTKGKNESEVPGQLVHFLKYLDNSTDECVRQYPDDLFIQSLHQKVQEIKRDRDKEAEYMLLGELLDEREELGEERGQKRGEELGSIKTVKLVNKMIRDGHAQDIPKLENARYRKKMMLKYNLQSKTPQ